jgi:ribonucleotide monophosphatase NagD (HAD superfamily)
MIAGKPYAPMATLVKAVLGETDLSNAWMVGDRASTDGEFAKTVNCKFAHVQSGVANASTDLAHAAFTGPDLASFADFLLGSHD